MWSCISFSQTLKPSLQQIEEESHFCFTIKQSKIIGLHLQQLKIDEKLIEIQNQEIDELFKLVTVKDTIISELQLQQRYALDIIEEKEEQLIGQQDALITLKEKLQKRKRTTAVWGVALFVVTSILIK